MLYPCMLNRFTFQGIKVSSHQPCCVILLCTSQSCFTIPAVNQVLDQTSIPVYAFHSLNRLMFIMYHFAKQILKFCALKLCLYFLFLLYKCFAYMFVCSPCVCVLPMDQKTSDPLEQSCAVLTVWCCDSDLGPLQEQLAPLIPEPSPQPQHFQMISISLVYHFLGELFQDPSIRSSH